MDKREKIAYVKALIYIATSDEKIEKEEEVYFRQIGNLYGIPEEEIKKIMQSVITKKESIESILVDITNRQTKLTLVYELLALCYANGKYTIEEKNGMKNICNILNVEASKLAEIEEIMLENIKLQEKIYVVLER